MIDDMCRDDLEIIGLVNLEMVASPNGIIQLVSNVFCCASLVGWWSEKERVQPEKRVQTGARGETQSDCAVVCYRRHSFCLIPYTRNGLYC